MTCHLGVVSVSLDGGLESVGAEASDGRTDFEKCSIFVVLNRLEMVKVG